MGSVKKDDNTDAHIQEQKRRFMMEKLTKLTLLLVLAGTVQESNAIFGRAQKYRDRINAATTQTEVNEIYASIQRSFLINEKQEKELEGLAQEKFNSLGTSSSAANVSSGRHLSPMDQYYYDNAMIDGD